MVLSELQLPDGNWKDVLGQLAPMIERPRLIVFSRNADNRLWEEVLNLGAFDLLITPFREHELVFAIGSAGLTGRVNKRTTSHGSMRMVNRADRLPFLEEMPHK